MNALLRMGAILIIAIKRLYSQRRLALLTTIGLTVAVGLTLSVPLYADAVYYRTLRTTLSGDDGQEAIRPPFAFMFRYVGSLYGPKEWSDLQQADHFLTHYGGAALGLPQQLLVRFFKTDNMGLFPAGTDSLYMDSQKSLAWVSFGTISDIDQHVHLVEGEFPPAATGPVQGPVQVLMAEDLAATLGMHSGESFVGFADKAGPEGQKVQVPIEVTGIWEANDPSEDFWFYRTTALAETLLVPEDTFVSQVVPRFKNPIYVGLWYLVMDGSGIHASDAGPLLGRIGSVRQTVFGMLPNLNLDISPEEPLQKYERSAALLTVLLYAFSVPIVGLILAFIALVVGLTVGQQRNEIAVLRSRGGTTIQVVGIAALEAVVLGLLAVLFGWPVSETFARAIGRAQSFLNFTGNTNLPIHMTLPILKFGLVTAGIALVTQMVPTFGAARHTIITYKQERARTMRRPWWQRAYLDILLLIPAGYGLYLLRQQGSIILPGANGISSNDPFQNPLLFLVPALGVFAATLVMLRIMPIVMLAIGWVAGHTGSVGLLMATRHLARTPGFYTAPLVLLVLTLSLSAFTASLAQTLDNHLYDQTYYEIGSDMRVEEMGESTETSGMGGMTGGSSPVSGTEGTTTQEDTGPRWLFLPVSEYLKVPQIQEAARVGRYTATAKLGAGMQDGAFIGVDRVDFSRVAYWRRDFATQPLGALMNALASTPDAVLAPRDLMAQNALTVGDTIRVSVNVYGQRQDIDMTIVGSFDLFPTWYPEEDGPLFVGNLEYLFEQAGGQFPYSVWLKSNACTTVPCDRAVYRDVIDKVGELGLRIVQWDAVLPTITEEQARPERQGLFGLLSVGFLAAALLTVLGFLLYAFFSFRRRTIELGILRAIGLSSGQMTSFLAWELAFLILTGLCAGTGLGASISHLFIPYLQVGTGAAAHVPPFLVEIAWPAVFRIYALFGMIFVIALIVLGALLLRMKIFQAIKLGETV